MASSPRQRWLAMTAADSLSLYSSVASGLVGLISLGLAGLALRARGRSGNRQLGFVAGAFLLFAAKSVFSAYNVWTHDIAHDAIELVLSLFDLVILGLLVLPLLVRPAQA